MNNNVNMRQLALILLVIIPGGKYLTLPAMLARQTGTDSWIVIATMLLIDLICLCFLLWAVGLNHRYELKDILNMTVGRPVAKIVFVIFLAFVLMRMVTLMTSAYDVFSASFAVNTNWLGFFIPVFLLMTFSLSRGFNAIARVNEALFTIIIICLICMLVYPATNANWEELYPVATDIGKLKETMENYSFWFSDYVFIYFLLSDIKSQKNVAPVTLICFITGSLFAVFMNTVFCALYGNTAQFYNPAMSKVSQFAVFASINGRLDWLFLSVWMMSIFIKLCVFAFCAYRCMCSIFRTASPALNWWIVSVIALAGLTPLLFPVEEYLLKALKVLKYPFAVVQYILPMTMPLLVTLAHRRTLKEGVTHEYA